MINFKQLTFLQFLTSALALVLLLIPSKIDSCHAAENSLSEPEIIFSNYDRIFQRVASEAGLDWHLLSAIAYTESRYQSTQRSRRGAVGLMQITPVTARQFNIPYELLEDPLLNVIVSAKLIIEIEKSFNFSGVSEEEKMKIILAGYNSGVTNLLEARKMASSSGANRNRWDDLKHYGRLNNRETRSFVSSVMKKWKEYKEYSTYLASVTAENPEIAQ